MKADTLFSIRTSEDSIDKNDLVKELDILIVLDHGTFFILPTSVYWHATDRCFHYLSTGEDPCV